MSAAFKALIELIEDEARTRGMGVGMLLAEGALGACAVLLGFVLAALLAAGAPS